MLWPLFFALVAIAISGLLFGLMAHLGWRLAARAGKCPRGTAAPSIPPGPTGWLTGSVAAATRPPGRPDWRGDTVELPYRFRFFTSTDAPEWRRDRAL